MALSEEIKVDKKTGLSYAREGLYDELYQIRGSNRDARKEVKLEAEEVKPEDLTRIEYKSVNNR